MAAFNISYFDMRWGWGTIPVMLLRSVTGAESDARVNRRSRQVRARDIFAFMLVGAAVSISTSAIAADLTVQGAWVAPNETVGSDVGLYMTVRNDSGEPDALLRATCPVANFTERRTVDVGEGGLSNRSIPNIPVPAHSTLTMTAKNYHVGLLQIRDKLTAGDTFICNLSFRKAGAMEVKVTVSSSAPAL